jgi:hypothetical protein
MDDGHIELYIDRGDAATNKQLFEMLLTHRESIEKSFGKPLEWQRLDEKRGCRIRYVLTGSGLKDHEKWPELQRRMVEAMVEFQRVFQAEINSLR